MPISEVVVIADASPLVHLDRIGRLDLLPALFARITVPTVVAHEVSRGSAHFRGIDVAQFSWVTIVPDRNDPDVAADPHLHAGEVAALSVARSTPGHLLIIDDLSGRMAAQRLRLHFIGTAGCIIRARKAGIIPAAATLFDALAANGFRLAPDIRSTLLGLVGET